MSKHRYVSQSAFALGARRWMEFAEKGDLIHLTDDDGVPRCIICIPQDDLYPAKSPKQRKRGGGK